MRLPPRRRSTLPDALIHDRAHEMLEEMLGAMARQGVSREAYLRIAGVTEHELAESAEPEAARRCGARR